MMIEKDFAADLLEQIEMELDKFDNDIGIPKSDNSLSFINPDYDKIYHSQMYCLPIYTTESTSIIEINKYFFSVYFNGIKEKHPQLVEAGIENAVEKEFRDCYAPSSIYSAISNKISHLVFHYEKVLEITIQEDNLKGIKDEERILKNHFNKYNEILRSGTKQIKFLRGITINKNISDLILMIYIRFVKMRLDMLNPIIAEYDEMPKNNNLPKFLWKGSQKELCELFIQLQKNEWIDTFKYGRINQAAKLICNTFDLSKTQKNANSNLENSFYQILKGKNNPTTKQREYDEVFGENYEFKFEKIKNN